jgi:hypothetical protein
LSLNGKWEIGADRHYSSLTTVPGLATDPKEINPTTLWYRRAVRLPEGSWTNATLILNGARFCPSVYVNGQKVSEKPGGMTVTTHLLDNPAIAPGRNVVLEIVLKPLDRVDARDASRIPDADLWRSNVSSCLWDNVTLHLHGASRINRVIPFTDIQADRVSLKWQVEHFATLKTKAEIQFEMIDEKGRIVANVTDEKPIPISSHVVEGRTDLDLKGACDLWSPEHPVLYTLRATLLNGGKPIDRYETNFGYREFKVKGIGFVLNNKPIKLRAGTVVWHRWLRDPEARDLGFDEAWFEKNILLRLKEHGANTIRFHLGMPPEDFLDLCDKNGLMVQGEWSFFHGMEASEESLLEQWRNWLDLCLRHPCVVLVHPWNETEGPRLQIAWSALNKLMTEYPPLVVAHRDVIHIHKYWWSLFENLGLYFDSAEQFDKPIMVDEFGGNYLDGNGNPGWYPTIRESLLRFLGPEQTRELRLQFQAKANARVAEYWIRLGAAGFSPFTILGSPEDGNHWFLGPLRQANPKPVWNALSAAWSPISVSLEVWDCNYEPGESRTFQVYFFNDTDEDETLKARAVIAPAGDIESGALVEHFELRVAAHTTVKKDVTFKMPDKEGDWVLEAILDNPSVSVRHPVISSWEVRTFQPKVPKALHGMTVGIANDERELEAFLHRNQIGTSNIDDPKARVIVTSSRSWEKTLKGELLGVLENCIAEGRSVVMLDIGPRDLGQGYPKDKGLGPLQGAPTVANAMVQNVDLFLGMRIAFRQVAEPESHLHPSTTSLDRQATWLWNGLRGGLIVPAVDMEVTGLSPRGFLSTWVSRGADSTLIKGKSYLAFEHQGFYAFSTTRDDTSTLQSLRKKVEFMVEDAPAIKNTVIPEAPINTFDLVQEYKECQKGKAETLVPLARCGKSLTRVPVVEITFGPRKGKLILSQLLTAQRLAKGYGEVGLYGIRYDPASAQVVLNMLKEVCADQQSDGS